MKCNTPKLTAKEMKAVREECQRQFDELIDEFNRQVVLQLRADHIDVDTLLEG